MVEDKKNIDALMLKQFGTYAKADLFVRKKLYDALHRKKIDMLKNLTERQRKALQKESYFKLFKDIKEGGFIAQVTAVQDHVEKKSKEILQVAKLEYTITHDYVRKDKERHLDNMKELKAAGMSSVVSSVNTIKGNLGKSGNQLLNTKKKMFAIKKNSASKLLLGLKSRNFASGKDIAEKKDTHDGGDEKNNVKVVD